MDAGTEDWYNKINRCAIPYEKLITVIKDFVSCTAVTIQTMLCAINGEQPSETEKQAWVSLVCELAQRNGNIRKVQLYGKARSSPEDPLASPLPKDYLEERAESLRNLFIDKGVSIPVEVYL